MKTKNLESRLSLRKQTVSNLDNYAMLSVKGKGIEPTNDCVRTGSGCSDCDSCIWCVAIDDNPPW